MPNLVVIAAEAAAVVDVVAKALCDAAGRSTHDALDYGPGPSCVMCEKLPDGTRVCIFWTSFRSEAQAAIIAAYKWHKKERRWPSFCNKQ
jgi:hypothetical protein